jgi:DNA-binding beta-propeller fold protein YncE
MTNAYLGAGMKSGIGDSVVLAILLALWPYNNPVEAPSAQAQQQASCVPMYQADSSWPKMEGHWIFGSIGGIAVDPTNDHVWVLQRPRTLADDEKYAAQTPPLADCCAPAPPVMEFDSAGNLIQGWGGPGSGYDWPASEHGITIDYRGNVWVLGNGEGDNQVLKFTRTGKFLLQIGHPGKSKGSNDIENFDKPTKAYVYPKTNEVLISDGYINRRVIVFDADTGAFRRLWGAYGSRPDDTVPRTRVFEGPSPQQFNLVHAVVVSNDDLVYVADRSNNRIQVFKPDGTYVKEAYVAREVRTPTGTVMDLAFSPDKRQQFLYVSGGDQHIRILDRATLQILDSFGRLGHYPGQFYHLHVMAIDSKSNIYTGENLGKRVQKFVFQGFSSTSDPRSSCGSETAQ